MPFKSPYGTSSMSDDVRYWSAYEAEADMPNIAAASIDDPHPSII
jgi:hypothetical protein